MQLFILLKIYFLYLPYMFRALISPSSGASQAVFYIQTFGSCGVYVAHLRVPVDWFVVVVSLYWCRGGSLLQYVQKMHGMNNLKHMNRTSHAAAVHVTLPHHWSFSSYRMWRGSVPKFLKCSF